jgi:RNA recognition motif-containing protein
MSKKIFIDAFFNQFQDFLEQLEKVLPNDTDIPTYMMGLKIMRTGNPMYLVREFISQTSPFETSLRARDEKFFLDYTFDEFADNDWLIQMINKLKGLWQGFSDNNKKCIWDYINLLLDIGNRIDSQSS